MICTYIYEKDYLYIPIHLNLILDENCKIEEQALFKKDSFGKSFFDLICNEINNENYKYYILDFSRISFVDECGTFFKLDKLLKCDKKNILICNLNEKIKKALTTSDCKTSIVLVDEDNGIYSSEYGKTNFEELSKELSKSNLTFQEKISKIKRALIINFFKEELEISDTILKSSNVFSNMYIDVKKIFNSYSKYSLLIYELCNWICDNFNDGPYELVCSSNNGLALATIIAQLLDLDVLYLINLGPNVTLKGKEYIDKISSGKRYLFIFDFLCLCNEYKITEFIIKYKGGDLIGSVGVALYTEPYRFEMNTRECRPIHKIFNVNDDDCNFEYKIYGELEGAGRNE